MENDDLKLINKLIASNQELSSLWREHMELEARLEEMNQRVFLSNDDQMEIKRVKKVKLSGRDRIEAILAEHRAQNPDDA